MLGHAVPACDLQVLVQGYLDEGVATEIALDLDRPIDRRVLDVATGVEGDAQALDDVDVDKDGKIDDATYKECYPSGSTTPSASVAIKAHKASKDYPARVITSHIGAPQERIASHLNSLLQPLVDKSPLICKNSTEFVKKVKSLKLLPGSKMFFDPYS